MLTVITPAPELGLLSIEELRAAVGLAADDTSRDAELTKLGRRVAGEIASFCEIARAGDAPPTLRAETVEEVQRLDCGESTLILARRFVGEIVSVTAAGAAVSLDLLELDGAAGLLHRLNESDRRTQWGPGRVVVRYAAGFETVPDDLKACATDMVRLVDSGAGRDPLLRARQIDGVGRDEFQIASGMVMQGGIPKDIADRLAPYTAAI